MADDHNRRIDLGAEFIAATLDVRNALAGHPVTRRTSRILDAVKRMAVIYERQDAALREAREQGAASAYREMRLWHEARYKAARDLADRDGLAGAHASAHCEAAEYCRSREMEQQEPDRIAARDEVIADAERARIVAWLKAHTNPGGYSYQALADRIERGEHAQPEPAR